MAEEDNKEEKAEKPAPAAPKGPSKLPLIVATVNMVFMAAVGFMFYSARKKDAKEPSIDKVINGEEEALAADQKAADEFIGQTIPLETFLVNLAGAKGSRFAKVNMELEVENTDVQEELEKRKPQIRDIILILLSSKTHNQVSSRDGKDSLREEVKKTLNSFLTKGKIRRVYFTDFLFQ